jgi:hypothetical protein
VALKLFPDGDVEFKVLHETLVDTGFLIKRNRLPDDSLNQEKLQMKSHGLQM